MSMKKGGFLPCNGRFKPHSKQIRVKGFGPLFMFPDSQILRVVVGKTCSRLPNPLSPAAGTVGFPSLTSHPNPESLFKFIR